ncbi:MAG: hypothetical protein JO308_05035 [Verrucomicrobia bacterium]|nr:hypothetical protein [Verrucomicrobiota bacterium]
MAVDPLISEYADFCSVCTEMTVLGWIDKELDSPVCEDCAAYLFQAECILLAHKLNPPATELIKRNP